MPHRLGRYAVRRRIGSGGFATVWLAYDEQLDSPVAIKVLADNWTEDHHVRQRFLEEGRYLRKVESPHVVTVYDAGELDDGRPYLVMSYADQGTLADRLERRRAGGWPQAMEVVRQVGAGLQALHDRDILHRDVKPANVLFRSVDGGASDARRPRDGRRPRPGQGARHVLAADHGRRHPVVRGARSRRRPRRPDARADQYSLAALTFLLLTGRPPFTGTLTSPTAAQPGRAAAGLDTGAAVPAGGRGGAAPRAGPQPRDRYPTVTAFVDALAAALGPVAAGPAPQPWLPPRPGAHPARPAPHRAAGLGRAARAGRCRGAAAGGSPCSRWPGCSRWPSAREPGYAAHGAMAADRAHRRRRLGHPRGHRPGGLGPGRRDRRLDPAERRRHDFPALAGRHQHGLGRPGCGARASSSGCCRAPSCPEQVPQHPECGTAGRAVAGHRDGDELDDRRLLATARAGGSSSSGWSRLTANQLLWVQVRSADRAVANQVLDDVETHGIVDRSDQGRSGCRSACLDRPHRVGGPLEEVAQPFLSTVRPVTDTEAAGVAARRSDPLLHGHPEVAT